MGVVTSSVFWEFACQSGGVLVRFGLRRGDLGMGSVIKRLCVWVVSGWVFFCGP